VVERLPGKRETLISKPSTKKKKRKEIMCMAGRWWLTPAILVSWKTEMMRNYSRQIVPKTPSPK
jgi:hypothetical protein